MKVTATLSATLALLSSLLAFPLEADDASSQSVWRSPLENVDPPRNEGWIAKLLGAAGEGSINVKLQDRNLTLVHRPSAFPASLSASASLPLAGILLPIADFPSPLPDHSEIMTLGKTSKDLGCYAPLLSRPPTIDPSEPLKIALVVRGSCPFSTKVRAAQERGASAVIVGDGPERDGETDAEGRQRDTLITMFSPDDTDDIEIPSVFVSRASFLILRDLLHERRSDDSLWLEIGQGIDEGSTLSSILLFALLCPSMFLLFTIFIHKIRMARQRDRDRAPPLVVLSLPERIWTPETVWEKDDDAPAAVVTTDDAVASTSAPVVPATAPRKQQYYSKDECAICMEAFVRGDSVRILPCGHVFHKVECDEWLLKWRKLCPTCRADVTLPGGASVNETNTPVTLAADSDPAVQAPRAWAWQRLLASFRRQRIVLHERDDTEARLEQNGEAVQSERLV